jgi:hypothetical protein
MCYQKSCGKGSGREDRAEKGRERAQKKECLRKDARERARKVPRKPEDKFYSVRFCTFWSTFRPHQSLPEVDFGRCPGPTFSTGGLGCTGPGTLKAWPSPTLCYAKVLPARKSGVRAGFRSNSERENLKIGPPAGRRFAGVPMLRPCRLESGRNSHRKPDFGP